MGRLLEIPYISFFTSSVQADFWQVLRAVLYVAMPLVLIGAAFEYGGQFFSVIRNAFSRNSYGGNHDRDLERDKRDYDI